MATWTCLECTTAYAVGLQACPNCRATDYEETGMPKITVASGATYTAEEKEAMEWPSETSSSASETKPSPTHETSEADPQKPAPTTETRSAKGRKGSSTARSVTTSGPETGDSDTK